MFAHVEEVVLIEVDGDVLGFVEVVEDQELVENTIFAS
jgi:hypothetical protein